MRSSRGLIVLASVLIGSVLLSVLVNRWNRPEPLMATPFKELSLENISEVRITHAGGVVALEKHDNHWEVTAPLKDRANEFLLGNLVVSMQSLAFDPVISESVSRHAEFGVTDTSATRVELTPRSASPSFPSLMIGSSASSGGVYARLGHQPAVALLRLFPGDLLRQPVNGWRDRRIFHSPIQAADQLKITQKETVLDVAKSSDVWIKQNSTVALSSESVAGVLAQLNGLGLEDFVDAPLSDRQLGWDQPYLTVSVRVLNEDVVLTVGKVAPASRSGGPEKQRQRYARVTGRAAVFVISETPLSEMVAAARTLR